MQYGRTQNLEPRTAKATGVQPEYGYSYRNLIVWQKAQTLTLAIDRMLAKLPDDKVVHIVTDQILRSASSIGANVAEGHGRFSLAAHANYISIAKASACETDNWLDLLRRAEYISPELEAGLHADCTELIRMLTSKIMDLGRLNRSPKAKSPRVAEEVAIYGPSEYSDETATESDLASGVPGSQVLGSPGRGKRGAK